MAITITLHYITIQYIYLLHLPNLAARHVNVVEINLIRHHHKTTNKANKQRFSLLIYVPYAMFVTLFISKKYRTKQIEEKNNQCKAWHKTRIDVKLENNRCNITNLLVK